jgi:hypothetical protein
MADPFTIGAVGAAAGGAGSIIQGIGAGFSGEAQASASRYKAGVALLNQQINKQNANWAIESGDIKGEEAGLKSGQEIAQTKTTQSGSGFDVTGGTNEAVRDTQTKVAQFDQNVIQWDAAKTAWGFESKAATDEAESKLDLMAADTESKAGQISEVASFIGGASSVASKWYQGKATGIV